MKGVTRARLVQGGASSYNLQQGLFMLVQKVESLAEAMKFQNSALKAMFGRQQAKGDWRNSL